MTHTYRRARYDAILRLCLFFLVYLVGTLIWAGQQQQASVDLAIAKGQQLYLTTDGQPVGVSAAALANFQTADSSLIFVNALPLSIGEALPWENLGCSANNCAHIIYFDRENGGTLNNIVLLPNNTILATWTDALARPAGSQFIVDTAIAIAANDPGVTAVLGNIGAGNPAMIPMSAWLADDDCRNDWCVDLTFHSPSGDGRIFHVFVNMTQETVARTFFTRGRPTLDVAAPVSQRGAFTNGCHEQDGWNVCWEMTAHDGVLFRDATYNDDTIFSSIKITQIEAWYPSWPGGYRDEIGFAASVPPFADTVVTELEDGFEVRQMFTEFTHWPNCICCYRYEQIIRFFADGSFEPRFVSHGPGCDDLSIYRPFWRINLDLDDATGNHVWLWQEDEWEEMQSEQELYPFVDSLGPDSFKLGIGGGDLLYRLTMFRTDPLGLDEARVFVLKENEGEGDGPLLPGPGDTFQPPRQWLDGESIAAEKVVFWYVPLLKTKKTEPLWCAPDPEPGINQCEAILRVQITDELPQPTAEELAAMEATATPIVAETAVTPAPTPTYRPVQGDSVEEIILNSGCGACHAIGHIGEGHKVGPDLSTIGYEATGRIPDMSATEYIRQSILDPNFALAPTCPNGPCLPNIMPKDYEQRLTPAQVELIVDYLLALDGSDVVNDLTVVGDGSTAVFPKGSPISKAGDSVTRGDDSSTASVQLVIITVVFLLTLFLLWKRPYEK
ncbi:MAG: c-type cytochrome [Chloroflexi bacterium]|nr:c-type cytochrome [Chloroflexota bacterium]